MAGTGRRVLSRALTRAGWTVRSLDGAVVVQRGDDLTVRRMGQPDLRAAVVYDAQIAQQRANHYQKALTAHQSEQHLMWVFRRLGINCVLDVGANEGQFAEQIRRAGYTGRIVSYEPVAHLLAALREKAGADPAWLVEGCALGDEEGTAQINVVEGTMSSLLPASEFGREWSNRLGKSRPETIRIRRLDAVLDDAIRGLDDPRIFLKMDTQGYDLATVHGAGDRLSEVVGLQSEVSCVPIYDGMPRMTEQLDAYEAEGFAISAMFPVSRHVRTMRVIEFDVVMVRPEQIA
jgi:FkbM family methyltransferase